MASELVAVENRLRANTGPKLPEFSTPVPGLISLRHADKRFSDAAMMLHAKVAVIQPVLAPIETLALQSRQLHFVRDLLLPRLMSGEIEA